MRYVLPRRSRLCRGIRCPGTRTIDRSDLRRVSHRNSLTFRRWLSWVTLLYVILSDDADVTRRDDGGWPRWLVNLGGRVAGATRSVLRGQRLRRPRHALCPGHAPLS